MNDLKYFPLTIISILKFKVLRGKPIEVSGETDTTLRDGDGESDCLADRAAALDEQQVN